MEHLRLRALRRAALPTVAALAAFSQTASAQVVFSIDYFGTTIAAPPSFGAFPITEGDILTPALGDPAIGPLPVPGIDISVGAAGLGLAGHTACVAHPPGTPCVVEVDALSYGRDGLLNPTSGFRPGDLWFSVDPMSGGFAGPLPPSVASESGAIGDSASDAFGNALPMPPGPLAPFAALGGNTGIFDGNGTVSLSGFVYPGFGLTEPNFPILPPLGDNLDALNVDGPNAPGGNGFPATGVYFSLDGVTIDPFTGLPGSGSAPFHGFSSADVLLSAAPGGPPAVYAPAPLLGLDLLGPLDDLDALILWENGAPGFQPSAVPYDWTAAGGPDMLLFSVRRGSPVVGMPDSIFGIPIEPGDVLTTPLPTAFGGVSPFPGIFVAAENLNLLTARSHGLPGDEIDALDSVGTPFSDCNMNGIEDAIDIAMGSSSDLNSNGKPDECELIATSSCFCGVAAPCANSYPAGGCRNSSGLGSILSASGTGSVGLDDLVLTATQVPTGQWGIMFRGTLPIGPLPFGDGLRCVGGSVSRFPIQNSGALGILSEGPGIAASEGILPAETWHFQAWFRDPIGPCGTGFNTSNALTLLFTL